MLFWTDNVSSEWMQSSELMRDWFQGAVSFKVNDSNGSECARRLNSIRQELVSNGSDLIFSKCNKDANKNDTYTLSLIVDLKPRLTLDDRVSRQVLSQDSFEECETKKAEIVRGTESTFKKKVAVTICQGPHRQWGGSAHVLVLDL